MEALLPILSSIFTIYICIQHIRLSKRHKTQSLELIAAYKEIYKLHGRLARTGKLVKYMGMGKQDFTADEIKKLIALCHPDKHGGKQSAHDMTAKLLNLRK